MQQKEPGQRSRYSDWLRAVRPRGRSLSPGGGKGFLLSMSSKSTFFSNFISGVWSPTGSTRHVGHKLAYYICLRVITSMENLVKWWLVGETEVLRENLP
jgi:hypothetical protein